MTLLTMIQASARDIGITVPDTVIGNTNPMVQELLQCAQDEGFDLMRRGTWQEIRKQQTFLSTATEEQTNCIPTDLDRFIEESFWNRTRKRPLYGPVTPQEWQNLKAWTASPVVDTFCMRSNAILVIPTMTAGETCAFEYVSKNWCQSPALVAQDEWTADGDTGILSERIMQYGVIWRYRQKKGLPWQADYDKWDSRCKVALGGNQPQRTINFGDAGWTGRRPGITIPEGSWTNA